MRVILFIILITSPVIRSAAQYFQFSQYNYTEQRVNPALVGASDYATASFDYRTQKTGSDIKLNSNFVSCSYPLLAHKTGRRFAGVGISVMDDRTGQSGILKTQEVAASYAANIFINRYQTFTLGMKGLYQIRNVNLDGLYTESQYIPDRGFDESLSNGESFQNMRNKFFTLSAGIFWQQTDRNKNQVAYWGVSFFDFNKPNDSFGGVDSRLNTTSVWQTGVRIYNQGLLSVYPEVLYTRSAGNNIYNIGTVTRYALPGNDVKHPANDHLDIITKYVIGRSGIIGLQLWRTNFSIGLSYDFPVIERNVGNLGAFEVGLQIRKLMSRSSKNRKQPAKKSDAAKTSTANKVAPKQPAPKTVSSLKKTDNTSSSLTDSTQQTSVEKKSLTSSLKAKQDSVIANAVAGNITHQPLVLEKITLHFNFEFNSSEMDESSMRQIDDLSEALKENEHLKVKLTGHTDNIGSVRFNQRLSVYRADEVKNYLIQKGIDPTRIETDGKGMSEPLNENKTEEERAKNRRVELTILYEE